MPEWAEDADLLSENKETQPLLNFELDENFANINSQKLDISGKIPTKELRLFTQTQYNNWKDKDTRITVDEEDSHGCKIYMDGNNLVISASQLNLDVGSIISTGSTYTNFASALTTLNKYIHIGYDNPYTEESEDIIDSLPNADGAGILIGDTGTAGQGFLDLTFVHGDSDISDAYTNTTEHSLRLKTLDYITDSIAFRAGDFVVTSGDNNSVTGIISLVNTHNAIDALSDLINQPSFATSYSIDIDDSLKEAIEALDAENIPAIKDFIGIDAYGTMPDYNNNDDPYTSVVSDGDSLVTAIANLNSAMNYVIRNVEERTETFIAHSGTMYLVDPYGIDDPYGLVVTLSDTNAGAITIRVESEGEVNVEAQSGNSAIEDNSAGAGNYYPLTETKSYQFIWQSTGANSGIWRIV